MAWKIVVELYSPLVLHWLRRAGLPDQECADVIQEIFRSAYTGVAKFRQESTGTFRGWLRTIARNKVIDHFRRRSKQPDATGGSEAAALLHNVPDLDDEKSALAEYLCRLTGQSSLAALQSRLADETAKAASVINASLPEPKEAST